MGKKSKITQCTTVPPPGMEGLTNPEQQFDSQGNSNEQPEGELVYGESMSRARVEVEYNEEAEGFTVIKYDDDGNAISPPMIWHEDTLDGAIKRLSQEYKVKVVIQFELRPK